MVKIVGERFASGLSDIHPMGAYLEALHNTGSRWGVLDPMLQISVGITLFFRSQ